ncbi:GrpB family protein [Halalkalibacter alkalisediminis]|uniref:GrpB family protein n=1 Tax=Halalkalibacter alkalisediminis TaxID=935616 RepID=A0ABV6NAX0_9BACI|nr:GrpB family protein [Halalkalibacter alkalisediminis]
MSEIVTFFQQETFREAAHKVIQKHKQLIQTCIPGVEIRHIGSTATEGLLTKGDVDLQVRVGDKQFNRARVALLGLYELNRGSFQTSYFCAFEKMDEQLPLGVQLTVKHSGIDHFWKVTEFFKGNPTYIQLYNELKRKYEGKEMEAYRKEKADFFHQIFATKEYQVLSKQLEIYDKVKFVRGDQCVQIEDTFHLDRLELLELIEQIMKDDSLQQMTLTIQVDRHCPQTVGDTLVDYGFYLQEEKRQVKKNLYNEREMKVYRRESEKGVYNEGV